MALCFLDDVVVAESNQEQAIWDNSGGDFVPNLTERNASGFPVIVGTIRRLDSDFTYFHDGYVLFPIAVP